MAEYFVVEEDGRIVRKGTLAHMLDRRNTSIGEPTRLDVPETVNPYRLVTGMTGSYLCTLRIRQSDIRDDWTRCLPMLQQILPVGSCLIVMKELEPHGDTLSVSSISEEASMMSAVSLSDTFQSEGISD